MKTTLLIVKADIGNVGGRIKPGERLLKRMQEFVEDRRLERLHDSYACHSGDDIAVLLAHSRGINSEAIHKPARHAFVAG